MILYSMEGCAACVAAKQLLTRKGIPHEVVMLEEKPEAWDMLKAQGLRSLPQLFFKDVLVPGGFQALQRMSDEDLQKFK